MSASERSYTIDPAVFDLFPAYVRGVVLAFCGGRVGWRVLDRSTPRIPLALQGQA